MRHETNINLNSFLFLISVLFQILLARHHKREKRFGPSPANDYTWGSGRKFWSRKKNRPEAGADALPGHPAPTDLEMDGGAATAEKGWFGRNKAPTPTPPTAAPYGYGSSAYTGNY